MKHIAWKTGLILLFLVLVMPSCLDIWITTQINTDGSIEQTISFQGDDSTEIADARFALMKENDWKREWSKPEKDKVKLVLSKKFSSVKELNKTMNPVDTSILSIRVNSTLHRKFRWFFTRYEYEQTLLKANPFTRLDYHNFFTDDDIRLLVKSEEAKEKELQYDSTQYKALEKRLEDFMFRSMFEDFYHDLTAILNEDKTLTLTLGELETNKENIFRYLVDSVKGSETDQILDGIGSYIHHPDISLIQSKYSDRFNGFQEKVKFHESTGDDNYQFVIRMPGLLLQTNSTEVKGADLTWDPDYYSFFFYDFTMTAESRKVNTWAFILAGLILIVALASLISAVVRKR